MVRIAFPTSVLIGFVWLASKRCAPTEARSILLSDAAAASRELQEDSTGCSTRIATSVTGELAASYGILFTIESSITDNIGPILASLGFHVETNFITGSFFNYEVYTLNDDGYYADPERTDNMFDELSFDYRGLMDQWSIISSGQVDKTALRVDEETFLDRPDYYEIPFDQFTNTPIPPNAGRKSFYITLTTASGLMSIDPGNSDLNTPSVLIDTPVNSPRILVGEGATNYPFPANQPYMYATRSFLGKNLFEAECTPSPSISAVPSSAPTLVPSYSPSSSPSAMPSLYPSNAPSVRPSVQPSPIPSMMPSISLSDTPSSSPTITHEEVRSGLLLTLNLPGCSKSMSPGETDSVAETVQYTAVADAEENGITNINVEVVATATDCERRRLSDENQSTLQRRLPSDSSAVEFSLIITGNFRSDDGTSSGGTTSNLDLGKIAEDSINADQDRFIRDLEARAPEGSSLTEVQSLEIQAIDAPEEGEPFTRRPTQQTTPAPAVDHSKGKQGFYIAAIMIMGIIVFLASFLFFRLASRYELRKRKLHVERVKKQRDPNDRRSSLAKWAATRRLSLERLGSSRIHPASERYPTSKKSHSRLKNDRSDRTGETSIISESHRSGNAHINPCFNISDVDISLNSHDNNLMHQEMPSGYTEGSLRHIEQLFRNETCGYQQQRPSARELSVARDSFRVCPNRAMDNNGSSIRMNSLRFRQASL